MLASSKKILDWLVSASEDELLTEKARLQNTPATNDDERINTRRLIFMIEYKLNQKK